MLKNKTFLFIDLRQLFSTYQVIGSVIHVCFVCAKYRSPFFSYGGAVTKVIRTLKGYDLRIIEVLRHQRGGWVGWPNDDVWWQGGWMGLAKWWRDQRIYKEMPITSIKTNLKSIYPFEDIIDLFNSSNWFFFWKNEPEIVCVCFSIKSSPV